MVYALSAFLPLVIVGLALWAAVRILHKAGHSGWWLLLWMIPIAGFIGYWQFAFAHWPNVDDANKPDVNAF